MDDKSDVTLLLRAFRQGDRGAFDRLVPLVYDDLRRIARRQLRRGGRAGTLNTTGLVHEAWLRLVDQSQAEWQDRGHFLAVAARAMRQITIDHARRRLAAKRGGGAPREELDESRLPGAQRAEWLLALEEALEHLARHNERLVRVVECRFFAGFSEEETAEALGVSLRTAQRDWLRARAWLREELREIPGEAAPA
jgi:RNA polymerase sigma factor (TIGR02999 family)